jgi:hypothetical protein
MKRSAITVHIEELAVYGLSSGDAARLEADLQRELVELIVERGVSPGLASQRVARVDGGVLRLQPNTRVSRLAREVAAIVHRSVGGVGTSTGPAPSPRMPNVRPGAR